jgi:hypothetical protein
MSLLHSRLRNLLTQVEQLLSKACQNVSRAHTPQRGGFSPLTAAQNQVLNLQISAVLDLTLCRELCSSVCTTCLNNSRARSPNRTQSFALSDLDLSDVDVIGRAGLSRQ